jgi:hypothetical protein
MAWDCGAEHCFDFLLRRHLALNIFPFPVTIAKLLGEFYTNRRSAANRCLRFAYSFVSFMLRQYYWSCDSYSTSRRSAENKKKSAKTFDWRCEFVAFRLLALRRRPASPLSIACNVAPITFLFSANTIGATSLIALHLFIQNSPITWAVLTGNRNMVKTR